MIPEYLKELSLALAPHLKARSEDAKFALIVMTPNGMPSGYKLEHVSNIACPHCMADILRKLADQTEAGFEGAPSNHPIH